MKSPIEKIAERRENEIAKIDVKIAQQVRNHLLQLFRAAHKVEPTITGVRVGMGSGDAKGTYRAKEEGDDEPFNYQGWDWNEKQLAQPVHPETLALLKACAEYTERLCTGQNDALPYINSITLNDLHPAPMHPRYKRA